MPPSIALRCGGRALFSALLACCCTFVNAQQPVWRDSFHGGVLVNNFSLGTSSMGGGIFQMPVPLGATIRSATLYGIEVAGTGTPTIVQMNNVDLVFGPTTTMTSFSYQTLYGPAVLHALDVTAQIDPTVTTYVLVVPPSEISHNRLVDLSLMIAYELPSEPLVWVDLFWCDHNSAAQEQYTVTTSAPMRTANSVAFATMASYCNVGMHDCEDLRVNGTLLGTFGGDDFNAASTFGTSASLKYSGVEFIGLGDDNADLAINGPDVLTDISSLLVDQATTFQVRYDHCPSISLEDNLMNLMLVAYTSDLCAQAIDLGPDTVLCAGETLVLDATRPDATYHWQDGTTTPTYVVSAPGTYSVQLGHPDCDWAPDTVVVQMNGPLAVDLGPDLALCEGASGVLSVPMDPAATYVWTDGATGAARTVTEAGDYILNASIGRCSYADTVTITIDSCRFDVQLPNVFSPNGDAINTCFTPIAMHGVASLQVAVYNRWGQELFSSTELDFRWYGVTSDGAQVPEGVYYWVLRYIAERGAGEDVMLKGTVTILR